MKRARKRGRPTAVVVAAALAIGFGLGWVVRGHAPRPAIDDATVAAGTAPDAEAAPSPTSPPAASAISPKDPAPAQQPVATGGRASAIDELREHELRVPIDGATIAAFKNQFDDRRENGSRLHEAVDILAPRNTPVHAVENGKIAKLFFSKGGGGNTVYQFDPSGRFCYYYAHLERYAPGLKAGEAVSRGDVIGFVGTSGNAPPNTPHLHFAVFVLGPAREWWKGLAIDPYLVFSR